MIQQSPEAVLHAVLSSESMDAANLHSGEITHSVKRVAVVTDTFLPKIDGVSRTALLTIKYEWKNERFYGFFR